MQPFRFEIATLSTGIIYAGQCCGSGFGQIRIVLLDPDRYQFQTNEKVNKMYFFPKNPIMVSKILKLMTPLKLTRKITHSKLARQ